MGRRLRTRPQRIDWLPHYSRRRPLHTSRSSRTAVTQRWRSKRTPGRRACRYNIALALDRSDAQKLPPRTLCALVRCARGNDCRHGPQGPPLIAMRPKLRLVACLLARARPPVARLARALRTANVPICRHGLPAAWERPRDCAAATTAPTRRCARTTGSARRRRSGMRPRSCRQRSHSAALAARHSVPQCRTVLCTAAQTPHPPAQHRGCAHSLAGSTAAVQPPLLSQLSGGSAHRHRWNSGRQPRLNRAYRPPSASGIPAPLCSWACNTCT